MKLSINSSYEAIKLQKIKYSISINPVVPYHQLSHNAPKEYLQLPHHQHHWKELKIKQNSRKRDSK